MSEESLTRTERTDLQRLARMRAKFARNGIEAAKAERLHVFERELQARYAVDDDAWAELTAQGKAQVQALDQELARRCEALGIRPEFRPSINIWWRDAGQNASKERQTELRRLARLELDSMGKAAKQRIDAAELETVTAIVAVGLGSQARELLEAMPSVDELLPALEVEAIESKTRKGLRAVGGGL